MNRTVDFYFDVGSPTAYLAHRRLQQLGARHGLQIRHMPMLLGGVFKATGNTSPVAIPAKVKYMLEQDLPRFARRYGVGFQFNPHFPINTLHLMRGVLAAGRLGHFDTYVDAVYDAMWLEGKNLADVEVVTAVLSDAGLEPSRLLALSQDPEVKAELGAVTEAAVARGVFGAPTLFMDGEMFFGQDRLDFIEQALGA